ncbi:hypothetical protein Zmor_021769 [Zophobas morio]|uniref:Uncharacterized protein n=1 Tax=Zophobas morio TaxID=2755281 RepID=A0AA38MAR6_9CUCU|nr:hypothetical protein Zmor_021769 [Zophobas morio]
MNEENCEIPEHILKKAQKANENVLPGTSRSIYEKEYKIFVNWKIENSVNIINETIMMAYFQELSEKYSSSSLWSKYSMVKATLGVNDNIDISNYHRLTSF